MLRKMMYLESWEKWTMTKKGYDGPTWEELAEGGMSPKMIEATLAEHGFYDEEEEDNDEV